LNRFFHIVFFPLLHLVLLAGVIWKEPSVPNLFLLIIFGIFSIFGFVFLYPRKGHQPLSFLEIFLVSGGALSTYFLSVDVDLGPVISASMIGLASSYIPATNRKNIELKRYPFAIYCGAFVGMSSTFVFDSYLLVLSAGCITGFIYVFANNSINGIGGKHGSIAFSGVLLLDILCHAF